MSEAQQDFEYDLGGTQPASGLGEGGPIPADIYEVQAVEAELGLSSGGYAQVALQWQVINGEYGGRNVRDWITFAPKSGPFILKYMVALGMDRPTRVGAAALAAYFAREIVGKSASLTVGLRPYTTDDGTQKMGNKVVNIAPLATGNRQSPSDQLSEEELADVPF